MVAQRASRAHEAQGNPTSKSAYLKPSCGATPLHSCGSAALDVARDSRAFYVAVGNAYLEALWSPLDPPARPPRRQWPSSTYRTIGREPVQRCFWFPFATIRQCLQRSKPSPAKTRSTNQHPSIWKGPP